MTTSHSPIETLSGADFSDLAPGPWPRPVTLRLGDDFLQMTMRKVQDYRPTKSLHPGWSMEGPSTDQVDRIAKFWASEYDWRAVESKINEDFDHFGTVIEGPATYNYSVPLHFIHQKSSKESAIPVLLLHGWPSTSLEWSKVIGRLHTDTKHAFHVVAPDLPGYGFSPAPTHAGLGAHEMGHVFDALMSQLGYDRYGIITTDMGWVVGRTMVSDFETKIIGQMCDFFMVPPNNEDQARMGNGTATTEEQEYMAGMGAWFANHSAYSNAHAQKPLALALALGDSPMGLLGWCLDLIGTSHGQEINVQELITDVMMLWIPGPYANIRSYLELMKSGTMSFKTSSVPTGVSQWGWPDSPFPVVGKSPFVPESWIRREVNLAYFKRHESGGHFPAVQEPDQWVDDVVAFFYRGDSAEI